MSGPAREPFEPGDAIPIFRGDAERVAALPQGAPVVTYGYSGDRREAGFFGHAYHVAGVPFVYVTPEPGYARPGFAVEAYRVKEAD